MAPNGLDQSYWPMPAFGRWRPAGRPAARHPEDHAAASQYCGRDASHGTAVGSRLDNGIGNRRPTFHGAVAAEGTAL
jgi:hypothetical protein